MVRPIPPHVETRVGPAQLPPTISAEMAQWIAPPRRHAGVVLEIVGWVEKAAGRDEFHFGAQPGSRITGRGWWIGGYTTRPLQVVDMAIGSDSRACAVLEIMGQRVGNQHGLWAPAPVPSRIEQFCRAQELGSGLHGRHVHLRAIFGETTGEAQAQTSNFHVACRIIAGSSAGPF